ncbi:MAG: molybdate ABC transporter substrate-binding protein [Pseudomonadota bacterium]
MVRWSRAIWLLVCLLAAPQLLAAPLTVAVAANVKYAFDDLQAAFAKESGVEIRPVFSSAGKIVSQIEGGAPFDVFLSADMEYPEKLYAQKLAVTKPQVYAYGTLVLWTLKLLDLGKGLSVLTDDGVVKVALPNPRVAPYGRAAIQALTAQKLFPAVEPKLVYGESITQATQYIDSGAADIGFTAKSVVIAPEMHGRGRWVELPKDSYEPIAQGVVILKHGAETQFEAARRFVHFLTSPKAREIFRQYGYLLP